MARTRILVVDDDEMVRLTLCKVLAHHGFEVTCVPDVSEALKRIVNEKFDVLLSDLHMPGAGDGLTVVSAMRHANPDAVTMLLSAYPEMKAAANAILMQTDEILVKPVQIPDLIQAIEERIKKGPERVRVVESVATILGRTAEEIIHNWYVRVQNDEMLKASLMNEVSRCEHLPRMFRDLVTRLESFEPLGTKAITSAAACDHGQTRRRQGYTAAMMVEESRILQVMIFHMLQKNLGTIDFSVLLLGVMTIADEVDSQLSQAMTSYLAESEREAA